MTTDDGNGEPIFAATELLSFRVTVKLHAESILTQPESRPISPESAPRSEKSALTKVESRPISGKSILRKQESILSNDDLSPESALSGQESALTDSESALTDVESALRELKSALRDSVNQELLMKVTDWAERRLCGVRADARCNMTNVLKIVAVSSNCTQDLIAALLGMSPRGIKKVMSALQKMGMLIREGGDFGGKWKLVGFENGE